MACLTCSFFSFSAAFSWAFFGLGVNSDEALCNDDDEADCECCEDSALSAVEGESEGVGN